MQFSCRGRDAKNGNAWKCYVNPNQIKKNLGKLLGGSVSSTGGPTMLRISSIKESSFIEKCLKLVCVCVGGGNV